MSNIKKAMLLCAGLGTRMRPLTDKIPKPLIKVGGKTLMDYALDWFASSGVREVVVNTHYKAEMIEAHVKSRLLPAIHISYEPLLLETGGGINKALPLMREGAFFSANSDAICIDGEIPALQRLAEAWDDVVMDVLLLLVPTEKAIGYEGQGDFFVGDDGSLTRRGDAMRAPYIFTGVQLLHPRLFADAPSGVFSLNVLYNKNITPGGALSPRIRCIIHDGIWVNVGDPKGLQAAEKFLTG